MIIAVINFGHEIPNAPADRTKILKGIGGGSKEGTTIARIPCRRYQLWTFITLSSLNRFLSKASPPFRPTEYSNEHPISEPNVVNVAYFNIPDGSFSENVINSRSLTSGRDRNEESHTAST